MFNNLKKIIDKNNELKIPSMDFLVYQDGKEVFRYLGGAKDESKTTLDGSELYNIYSCSKPITVVSALKLLEQGKISLTDDVATYIPAFSDMTVKKNGGIYKAEKPITIFNLFTMTSGLNYDVQNEQIKRAKLDTDGRCPTLKTMDYIAKMPLEFEPGEKWLYSFSHDVLAGVVEAVSGKKFGEFVKENIFNVAGIKNMTFSLDEKDLPKVCAQYRHNGQQFVNVGKNIINYKFGTEYESGGAGCVSTTFDYVLFLEALRKGKLISYDTINLLTKDWLNNEQKAYYGFTEHEYSYGLGVRVPNAKNLRTDFGWGGAAGAYGAIDLKNKISLFYAQHVLNTPNKDYRKDIIEAVKLDLGLPAFEESMFRGVGSYLA